MADEKENKEIKNKSYAGPLVGIALLVIAGVAFYYFVPKDYRLWTGIGLIAGFLYGYAKSSSKKDSNLKSNLISGIISAIIFGAIAALLVFFWPTISHYASIYLPKGLTASLSGGIQSIVKMFSPTELQKQFGEEIWSSPQAKAPAEKKIDVEFVNALNKAPLEVVAKITAKVKDETAVNIQCFLDNNAIETYPKEIIFAKSDAEQHSSVTCSNKEGGKELSLKMNISDKIKSIMPLWIGKGENRGIAKSAMDHESYYSMLLETLNDQPLKDGKYPLLIKIKREEQGTMLKDASLEVSTLSGKVTLNCPYGSRFAGGRDKLEKWLANKETDGYVIKCEMEVRNAPEEASMIAIEGQMDYSIEKEFKTSLA